MTQKVHMAMCAFSLCYVCLCVHIGVAFSIGMSKFICMHATATFYL